MSLPRVLALAGCLTLLSGCFSLDEAAFFEENYRDTYQRVGACEATVHPIGGYQEVWVSPNATASSDTPEGSVLVKVQWKSDASCTPNEQDLFTAMRRTAPGAGESDTDWEWQTIGALGGLTDTDPASCAGCHAGCPGGVCTTWGD